MANHRKVPSNAETDFERVIRVFNQLLSLIGCDLFSDNYRPGGAVVVLAVLIACFNISCVNTMVTSSLAVAIDCSSYFGVGLQV